MCNPVALGVASLVISAAGTGASIYNSNQQAKQAEKNQKESIARQEKIIREAAPAEAELISTNEDMTRDLTRVRRGIAQNIYTNRNNPGAGMFGTKTVLGA